MENETQGDGAEKLYEEEEWDEALTELPENLVLI